MNKYITPEYLFEKSYSEDIMTTSPVTPPAEEGEQTGIVIDEVNGKISYIHDISELF